MTQGTTRDPSVADSRPSPIGRADADAVAARATPREMTHTHTQKTPSRATLHSRCPRATPAAVECESARARQSPNPSAIKKTPESTWHVHGTDGEDKVIHFFFCACDDTDDDDDDDGDDDDARHSATQTAYAKPRRTT